MEVTADPSIINNNSPGTAEQKQAFFRACEWGDLEKCKELAKILYPPLPVAEGDPPIREVSHILETRISHFPVQTAVTATPLHIAALTGRVEFVRFLLKDCHVNVNETVRKPPEEEGEEDTPLQVTALLLSFQHPNLEIARVLLEHGQQHGGNLHLPLYARFAVRTDNVNMLKLLLEYGANPEEDLSEPAGGSPLQVAMEEIYPEVLKVLLENGCSNFGSVHSTINSWNRAEPDDRAKIFRVLVQHAPAKQVSLYLCTSIVYKLKNEMSKNLVDAGADIHVQSPEGLTPILMALYFDNKELAHYLVDHGADPFVGGYFDACLFCVIGLDDPGLKEWILQQWNQRHAPANNDSNGNGNGNLNHLLHVACQFHSTDLKSIQRLLEEAPQVVEMVDVNGYYPYQLACEHHPNLSVLYTLLLHKPDMLDNPNFAALNKLLNTSGNADMDCDGGDDGDDGVWC